MKQCTKCGHEKAVDQFPKGERRCLGCKRDYLKAYYRENKEKSIEANREWQKANKAALKAKRDSDPDFGKKRSERYYKNPTKVLAKIHERRAKVRAGGSFTSEEWRALCEQYGNVCLCCGASKKLTIDHVVPIVLGGSNTIDNLQPLCKSCNCSKNAQTIDYRPENARALV